MASPTTVRARHRWSDALLSLGSVAIVVAALVVMDERARAALYGIWESPTPTFGVAAAQLRDTGTTLFAAAQHQALEHMPLMWFTVIATVLVVWMLRT